jgi:hypothetical protein
VSEARRAFLLRDGPPPRLCGFSKLAQQGVMKALGLVLIVAGFKLIGVY